MYDIHLHKHKTEQFSPENKTDGQRKDRLEFNIQNAFICTPFILELVLAWLTVWIISHLMLTHTQMSKGLIMFGKQLSWVVQLGFLYLSLKKKKKLLQLRFCSLMQQKRKERVIYDPQVSYGGMDRRLTQVCRWPDLLCWFHKQAQAPDLAANVQN